jgi:hypothetical protein
MEEPKDPLWKKLQTFQVDEQDVQYTFCERLAIENNWTLCYAQKVFLEYKKFLFLVCKVDHPVTPSDQVDQAWHLHLTYTKSYWDKLCNSLLGQKLHHNPTKGGESETIKFYDWYEQTLTSYKKLFRSCLRKKERAEIK